MNKLFLSLILLFAITMNACKSQRGEIWVKLSIVDQYLKMEVTNHSDQDYYVPHLYSFFSIYDSKCIEVTGAYGQHLIGGCYDFDLLIQWEPYNEEFMDKDLIVQNREYMRQAIVMEKNKFLELNPHVTEDSIFNEFELDLEEFLEILYVINKYDGIPVKAGQTLFVYERISGLYDNGTSRPREEFKIRFNRRNNFKDSVYETVNHEGYKYHTPLPDLNAGYKLYKGKIDCSDIIHLVP